MAGLRRDGSPVLHVEAVKKDIELEQNKRQAVESQVESYKSMLQGKGLQDVNEVTSISEHSSNNSIVGWLKGFLILLSLALVRPAQLALQRRRIQRGRSLSP